MPSIALFGTMIASVSLGIARHAIEAMVQLSQTKVPTRSAELLKAKSPAQVQLGEAEGLLRAGRAVMRAALDEAWIAGQQALGADVGGTTWAMDDRGEY